MCFSDVTPYTYSEFLVISCKGFLLFRQADKTKVLSPVLAHVQNSVTNREKICFFLLIFYVRTLRPHSTV